MILWKDQSPVFIVTKKLVEDAIPHSTMFQGVGLIEHPWFNRAPKLEDGGNVLADGVSVEVKLVIYRGGIADWCIYHSLDANLELADWLGGRDHMLASYERVASAGGKIHNREVIKALTGCDDETLALYRD